MKQIKEHIAHVTVEEGYGRGHEGEYDLTVTFHDGQLEGFTHHICLSWEAQQLLGLVHVGPGQKCTIPNCECGGNA